jgi:hypothetical protein
MVGGLPPGLNKPVAGTVVAVSDSGERCSIAVGAKNTSRFDLSIGVYTITGRSPSFGGGRSEHTADRQVTVGERQPGSHGPDLRDRCVSRGVNAQERHICRSALAR